MAPTRKILVVLGHPRRTSFCGRLAEAYAEGVNGAGGRAELLALGEAGFDPVLWGGYAEPQPLEPALAAAQEAVRRAEHLVFVFPTWWGSVPAILKGFFDRAFTPGFAFKYREKGPFWDKLLAGKSGEIVMTSDSPNFWTSVVYRNSAVRTVKHATLQFCGVKPVRVTRIDRVRFLSAAQRDRWIARARELGVRAAR
jgi:putative NADPH-quinone reductase